MHAITKDGPLCDREPNGYPIDDLIWNGDTPHPMTPTSDIDLLTDVPCTCETLWVSDSSSGDYHDNMNNEMFMQWVKHGLEPTFQKHYPDKKMILVLDNAPYHHRREIPVLTGKTKAATMDVIASYADDVPDAPFLLPLCSTKPKRIAFAATEEGRRLIVNYDGEDYLAIPFSREALGGRGNGILVPNVDELKLAFLRWLKMHKPELLVDKLEKFLVDLGHEVIWTPPYTPEIQPIENFWGEGKGYAAMQYVTGQSMKTLVQNVRDGWYGNEYPPPPGGMGPTLVRGNCGMVKKPAL